MKSRRFCIACHHLLDSSINFWKRRRKRSVEETNQNCGLDHIIQQKMEILQNGVIIEDEEKEQSYRNGAFDERYLSCATDSVEITGSSGEI